MHTAALCLHSQLFKYFRLNDQTNMTWLVLSRAARDMGFFGLMLCLFLLSFAIIGEQFFGPPLHSRYMTGPSYSRYMAVA